MTGPATIDDEALDWALRMAGPDADWAAFTDWLAADAARAERYDRAALAVADATASIALAMPPANDDDGEDPIPAPAPARTRRFAGAWLAVALLVVALGVGLWRMPPRSRTIATAAGERRSVALADGSRIELAGGTRLRLDPARPRAATIEAGEALFHVRHDPRTPFRVEANGLPLQDLGTVFDIRLLGGRTQVAVGEGAVMVDPDGAALTLAAGEGVIAAGTTLRRIRQDAGAVGAWRDGRLAYDGATLSAVAEDLSRQLGWRITAAPAVATRLFNGTLETQAFRDDPTLLGALLDVEVRRAPDGWTLDRR